MSLLLSVLLAVASAAQEGAAPRPENLSAPQTPPPSALSESAPPPPASPPQMPAAHPSQRPAPLPAPTTPGAGPLKAGASPGPSPRTASEENGRTPGASRTPSAAPARTSPARPAPSPRAADAIVKFGQDVHLAPGQAVHGPVVAFGGSVFIDGPVDGPVIALGGAARLGPRSAVSGPAIAFGGPITLESGAQVDGPVLELPGAALLARVGPALLSLAATLAALAMFGKLLAGAGWLVLGLVLWVLFPEALRNTRDTLEREPAACAIWGLLAWPALGMIGIAFLVSVVGWPLVPLVLLLVAAAYAWGSVALAFWLGSRLGRGRWDSALGSIMAGMLLLKLVAFVPLVRWAVCAVVAVLGAGAAFASRFGARSLSLAPPAVPK